MEPSGPFSEKAIRSAFISKVYSILTMQLIATSVLIGVFVLDAKTKWYFRYHDEWMYVGLFVVLISFIILACIESARRSTPINYILLSFLTSGYAFTAAVVSCSYDTRTVLFAFLATGVSCFLIAFLAKTTSLDLTTCGTTLCLLSLLHLVIGIILALIFPDDISSLLLAVTGALLVSLYLMFDLQLIMGGRENELSPEEYILGAVLLYTDIIQLFLFMLRIVGAD